jgi:hypothetical protein
MAIVFIAIKKASVQFWCNDGGRSLDVANLPVFLLKWKNIMASIFVLSLKKYFRNCAVLLSCCFPG